MKILQEGSRSPQKSLPLMPTYYTLHCLALLQPVRTCFVNYMQQFFVSPHQPKPSKNDIASSATMIDFKSSLPGGWEKYWNEHGLFFVQKMSVYICSMSDGCNLEKVYWSWVFLFSLHPHITTHWEYSKENEFPWELFWALFFSSCIEKQSWATRRDTKNSKVLLRW